MTEEDFLFGIFLALLILFGAYLINRVWQDSELQKRRILTYKQQIKELIRINKPRKRFGSLS